MSGVIMRNCCFIFSIVFLLHFNSFSQRAATSKEYENIIKSIRSLHVISAGKVPDEGITINKDAAHLNSTVERCTGFLM